MLRYSTNRFLSLRVCSLPTPTGIRCWGLCDISGYRLVTSVDGEMTGDPDLRKWFECPFGGTTRQVLWVMLGTCQELKDKLDGSGVFIAMDKVVTSAILLAILASHNIYAVCSCPISRADGAVQYWESLDITVKNRGDIIFDRSGEMSFVRWHKSVNNVLCYTIHIFQPEQGGANDAVDHFRPQPST